MEISTLILVFIKVEPYWNVNLDNLGYSPYSKVIKVEPYWNVNF